MAITVSIGTTAHLGAGVWSAEATAQELALLGGPQSCRGEVSVILLPELESPLENSTTLQFSPVEAIVLNLGSGTQTVLVFGGGGKSDGEEILAPPQYGPRIQNDDEAFIRELDQVPIDLRSAGMRLLAKVREEFKGYFQRTNTGRYVNRENNFWTVKVQPRDRSLRITLRGYAHEFGDSGGIEVKDDMRGYSSFKLTSLSELEAAYRMIQYAGRK